MEGDKYQVKITHNGLMAGTKKVIQYQGDSDFNTGEGLSRTQFKGRFSYSVHTNEGASLTLPVLLIAPFGEGLQLLYDAWQNKTVAYLYYEAPDIGSLRVHGQFKVVMDSIPTGVDGLVISTFTCSQVGKLTYEALT